MARQTESDNSSEVRGTAATVPPGAPDWVTAELIASTLRAWQPHYPHKLTAEDALEILLDVGRLFDLLEGTR